VVDIGVLELLETEDKRSESSGMYKGVVHSIDKVRGSWNGRHRESQRREGTGYKVVEVYL